MVLVAQTLQPVRTASAGCNDRMACDNLTIGFSARRVTDTDAAAHTVLQNQIIALITEQNLHAVFDEPRLNRTVKRLRLFSAEMEDRTLDKLKSCIDGAAADLLNLFGVTDALDVRICTEIEINFIGIFDHFLCEIVADQIRQNAADLSREGQLAVRKCTGTGESGCNMAVRLAVNALTRDRFRTASLLNRLTLFDDDDFTAVRFFCAEQLQC